MNMEIINQNRSKLSFKGLIGIYSAEQVCGIQWESKVTWLRTCNGLWDELVKYSATDWHSLLFSFLA